MKSGVLVSLVLAALCLAFPVGDCAAQELKWPELPPLPPNPGQQAQPGLAGVFAGVHNGALIVAGGANFPEAPVWEGGKKVWWRDIFVLERSAEGKYAWSVAGSATAPEQAQGTPNWVLPTPLAYGVSISTDDGVICIGGCDSETTCKPDVFLLKWNAAEPKSVTVEPMPPLPCPLAFMAGARVGNIIYVAGGQEVMGDGAAATKRFFSIDLAAKADAATFVWQELPAWPGPARILPVAAAQSNGDTPCLYLFSGRDFGPDRETAPLTDCYSFNPQTAVWQRLEDVAAGEGQKRCVAGATAFPSGANQIIVVGGDDMTLFMQREQLAKQAAQAPSPAEAEPLRQQMNKSLAEHPGFSKDILCYDTAANAWRKIGEFPEACPVTTPGVTWDNALVIPSGEVRPAVRSAKVWRGELAAK